MEELMLNNNHTIQSHLSDRLVLISTTDDGCLKYGVIDSDNNIIVPCVYDEIILDVDREIIEALTLNHCFFPGGWDDDDYYWSQNFLSGCYKYRLYYNYNGQQVIFDNNQEIILDNKYDIICHTEIYNECEHKLWPVKKNNLWGFVDNSGKEVIACKFKHIGKFAEGRCFVEYLEGWAIIDTSGNLIKQIDLLCNVYNFTNGVAIIRYWPEQLKESYHYTEFEKREVNLNGELILRVNNQIKLLDRQYTWFQVTKDNLIEVYSKGKYGLMDLNLHEIIPCRFDSIITSIIDNDLYITLTVDDDKDISLDEILNISKLDSIGKICVVLKNESRCLIFSKFQDRITTISSTSIIALSAFYSKIWDIERKSWKVISDTGIEIFAECQEVGHEKCGMIPVKSRGKCFYITIEGVKIELPDHTVTAESFQNGLGIIKVQSGKTYYKDEYLNGVRYGAVNKNGELIIPLIYEKLTWSDDSYISAVFRVSSFTKTNFKFNSKGEIVINNDTFKGVYSCEKLKDNTYRIISKEGVGIIDSNYNEILKSRFYHEHIDLPYLTDSKFFIRINKFRFNEYYCKESHEIDSLARIVTYKDNVAVSLPLEYTWADEWVDEYIPVMKDNNWGIIDSKLNEVSKFEFSKILSIKNDVALAINDYSELFKLDLNNKVQTKLKYEYVSHCKGRICVREWKSSLRNDYEANYGILDNIGNLIIECTHRYCEFDDMPDIVSEVPELYFDPHEYDSYYRDAFDDDPGAEWNRGDI